MAYTKRGWLQAFSASAGANTRYSFSVGTFAPNGDIIAANDSANGNWTYSYDAFNRLVTASATGQAYTYDYDRFGNRWHQNGPHSSSVGFDANNHVVGGSYDAAGDVASAVTPSGTQTYLYDAEGRLSTVNGGTVASYVYDAQGRRVRKTTSSGSVDYLYDLDGNQVAEVGPGGVFNRGEVYLGNRHIATYSAGPTGAAYFMHRDWLGTERVRTDFTGATCETITSLPFGDAQTTVGACTDVSPMHFAGKPSDGETTLDYFGARYVASGMGRFMSPDPLLGKPAIPQPWNLYAYAGNNPSNAVDPSGLDCIYINNDTGVYEGFNRGDCDNSTQEKANTGYYVEGNVDTIVTTTGNSSGVVTGYGGTSDAGSIFSAAFSTPSSNGGGIGTEGAAVAIFSDINRRNIIANTFKLYGAGAAIGATGGTACYYVCGSLGVGAITTLGATTGGTAGPLVTDGDLQRIVDSLFQATDKLPGGTAGAVTYEQKIGDLLSPALDSGKDSSLLERIFSFFERMACSSDVQVVNLLQVEIFERLVRERERLATAWNFMGPETKNIARNTARIWRYEKNLPEN